MKKENPIDYLFQEEKPINIREFVEKYLNYWKWFIVSLLIAFILGIFYLRYTPNQFLVTTTILIDNSEKGSKMPTDLSAFKDLGIFSEAQKSIENELGILKSRTLMNLVVKDLGINTTFYTKGRINTVEIYKNKVPVKINFLSKDSTFYKTDTTFTINIISGSKFVIKDKDDEINNEHSFGETISTKFGKMIVTPKNSTNLPLNKEIQVVVSPLKRVSEGLRSRITTALIDKNSSLITLSLKDPIKLKAIDILNDLIRIYNENAVEDKSKIGKSTNSFLNERLSVIQKDLSNADRNIEVFKKTNKLTDITSQATLAVDANAKIEKQIFDIKTQLKLANYVSNYLNNSSDQLVPANLGLRDGTISLNAENYNKLLLERNRILNGSSSRNPVIINLDNQLSQLRSSIIQGLENLKSSLNISLQDALNQKYRANSQIRDVPQQETQYRDIERDQKVVETLYLYLLQKREENSISLAITLPNSKIIDLADGSNTPVSPNKIVIMGVTIMLGLMIPFFILFIIFSLDNKVHTTKDIEKVCRAPIIGDVPKTKNKPIFLTTGNPDEISESFRMIRTNIFFMLSKIKGRGKIIFVTSTIGGEGKSFISTNMSKIMALSNKKVLLIGADIRKPNLSEFINLKNEKGLTHYLIDNDIKIEDVIYHEGESNLDIIATTLLAPNPSELLIMNDRFEELINYGKEHYDFVIVDSAPVKIVTDTFLIGKFSDLSLYVVRANYLDKRLLEFPDNLYKEKKLPNMAMLLNFSDAKVNNYGYGYGYGQEKKKGISSKRKG